MHNGLLRLTGEKMSKSLGNIQTLERVLDEWGRETLLLFFMTAHWRSPIDFSPETMEAARMQAKGFRNAFLMAGDFRRDDPYPNVLEKVLDDDFNTPAALALMHEWLDQGRVDLVYPVLRIFGLESLADKDIAPPEVEDLARRRCTARAERNFAEADRLRDEIAAIGWEVRDISAEPGYQLVKKD